MNQIYKIKGFALNNQKPMDRIHAHVKYKYPVKSLNSHIFGKSVCNTMASSNKLMFFLAIFITLNCCAVTINGERK